MTGYFGRFYPKTRYFRIPWLSLQKEAVSAGPDTSYMVSTDPDTSYMVLLSYLNSSGAVTALKNGG